MLCHDPLDPFQIAKRPPPPTPKAASATATATAFATATTTATAPAKAGTGAAAAAATATDSVRTKSSIARELVSRHVSDAKDLSGTKPDTTTPAPASSVQSLPPPRLASRAFRLAHATDAVWEYTGAPLSALIRIFPESFVDASLLRCLHCKKKRHNDSACPGSTSDWDKPPSRPLYALLQSLKRDGPTHVVSGTAATEVKLPLASAKARLIELGSRLNANNPFAVKPNISLFALPKRLGFWQAIETPKAELSWLAYGYQLRFLAPPPQVGFDNHPGAFLYHHFIDEELAKRVSRGQFSIVEQSMAKQIHPLDVVKKASGGYRLILDCRLINGFLPQIPFKLENLAVVPQIVTPGAWLFSTDLEDAYFHIPMHHSSRPHLCFQWRGKTYTTNVLPFGLSLAPWIFTKTLRPVIRFCRSIDISVIAYLDDFLWCDGKSSIDALVDFARTLLACLGFAVSEKKSEWTPTQTLQFLGLLVNSESYTFEVPKGKVDKIVSAATALRAKHGTRSKITAKDVAVICGLILSVRLAVAPARIYTRALYSVLNDASYWDALVQLSPEAVVELEFWMHELPKFTSLKMIPAQYVTRLHCDASDDGWGAHCQSASAFGYFVSHDCAPSTSSTYRELLGLLFAIRTPEIEDVIRGQRVMFVLDSLAAVCNLLKGGGPKDDLSFIVKSIWRHCISIGVDASAEWVSRNSNEYADFLSKYRDRADWRLNPDLFARIDARWGPHTVDRFASSHNTHCARFNSRYFDPGAESINAFNEIWTHENNFCNPDFNDLSRIVEHARRDRAAITLIFPVWESAPWFNAVMNAASVVLPLPAFRYTFLPGPRSARTVLTAPDWPVSVARLDFSAPQTHKSTA